MGKKREKSNEKNVKKSDPMADVKEYMAGAGRLALYLKEIQIPDPTRFALFT
jgi:hypothetical protein